MSKYQCDWVLSGRKKSELIGFEIESIERDRASGLSIHLTLKTERIAAVFYNLWINSGALSGFGEMIGKLLSGECDRAVLDTINYDGFSIELNRVGGEIIVTGKAIQSAMPRQTPRRGFYNTVSISFRVTKTSLKRFQQDILSMGNSFF